MTQLRSSKKWFIPPFLVIAILVWAVVLTMPDDNLRVSFLDVGQGDAILIQTLTTKIYSLMVGLTHRR